MSLTYSFCAYIGSSPRWAAAGPCSAWQFWGALFLPMQKPLRVQKSKISDLERTSVLETEEYPSLGISPAEEEGI